MFLFSPSFTPPLFLVFPSRCICCRHLCLTGPRNGWWNSFCVGSRSQSYLCYCQHSHRLFSSLLILVRLVFPTIHLQVQLTSPTFFTPSLSLSLYICYFICLQLWNVLGLWLSLAVVTSVTQQCYFCTGACFCCQNVSILLTVSNIFLILSLALIFQLFWCLTRVTTLVFVDIWTRCLMQTVLTIGRPSMSSIPFVPLHCCCWW